MTFSSSAALTSSVVYSSSASYHPLCLRCSQETWLDKLAWAIKATKSLQRRGWRSETFSKCEVQKQVSRNRTTGTHTEADKHRQAFFFLVVFFLSEPSSPRLLLLPSGNFLFVESPEIFASLWCHYYYYYLVSLGRHELLMIVDPANQRFRKVRNFFQNLFTEHRAKVIAIQIPKVN